MNTNLIALIFPVMIHSQSVLLKSDSLGSTDISFDKFRTVKIQVCKKHKSTIKLKNHSKVLITGDCNLITY